MIISEMQQMEVFIELQVLRLVEICARVFLLGV